VADGNAGLHAGGGAVSGTHAENGVPHWKAGLYAGLALVGGMVIGGAACYFIAGRKKKELEEPLVSAGEGEEAAQTSARSQGAASAGGAALPEPEPAPEAVDYERLLRMLSQRVAQKVGPKLAKGQAVRTIIEDRVMTIKEKAKAFFLNELNTTAGAVLKAVDAEEAMLLLDWNNTVAMNFPPISVLLAGLLSPTLLSLRQLAHLLQLTLGLLPILVLCIWAIAADWGAVCAIPTMFAWVYVQGGLALILSVANLLVYLQIKSGKKDLTAKAEAMHERLKAAKPDGASEEMGLSEMRELFVCSSVLLQQALLVEDNVRKSIWYKITGAGSPLWLITILWNFVLVMGWTFMPGLIAFHPKAATVASEAYCSALITVLAARIICMLHLLFMGINIMTLTGWVSDLMTSSASFGQGLLKHAAGVDQGLLGIPVAQTLVKAFVLRGGSELASSQLAVAVHERVQLERERAKAEVKLRDIEGQLAACKAAEEALEAKAGRDKTEDLEASITQLESLGDTGMDDLKAKGVAAIADIQAQAAAMEEATTKDLEVMIQKITEAAEMVKDSDAYKSALSKAQDAADLAQQKATQVSGQLREQLTNENLQSVMAQAQEAAQVGMAQAQQAAGQLPSSEALQEAAEQARRNLSSATTEFSTRFK